MKKIFFLLIFFLIMSCTHNKKVYWCGDHPCINKKEREAYFKKTMVVEIKDPKNKNYKNVSEFEKIIKETQLSEEKIIKEDKKLVKQVKLEEKRRIKEEKELAKQVKLEEKRRIKEEKKLAKQVKLEEKRRIKEEKKLAKQVRLDEKKRIKDDIKTSKKNIIFDKKKKLKKKVELDTNNENIEIKMGKFNEIVKKITKKNIFRPYPNINDMPN